jgi:hypothetical protein
VICESDHGTEIRVYREVMGGVSVGVCHTSPVSWRTSTSESDEYMFDDAVREDEDYDGDDGLPSELEDREPDTDVPPDEIDQPDESVTA